MDDETQAQNQTSFEIEHGHEAYTDEELLEQAQFNAQALLLAAVAALGDDEDTRERWAGGVAEVFARGWDSERSWQASEVLDALLTNYRSFGATVIEADLSGTPATAMIADLPDLGLAEDLGVPETNADALFRIGARIASSLGHSMEWSRDGETGDVMLAVS